MASYCIEYEIPTDEDISISEARISQNGDQGSSTFKVLRIQIYEHCTQGTEGPIELNPMLKQLAHTEICPHESSRYMQVRFHSFTTHYPLLQSPYYISPDLDKPHDGSTPIEFYPRDSRDVLVTKPARAPGCVRRHNERADCLLPQAFAAPITLTEKYMLLSHLNDVYLFAYEPGW